jgi:2-polyprenyl-3-methyl-5-hydroxy-6-metoxy-1,4-benzoquinol methylase
MLRVESPPEFAGFDAVVFGEVLKHSVNPLELLTDCVEHVRLDCHVELPASAQR